MPELTLYRLNGSCSFVPHAVLLHFGIPFKAVRMRQGPDGYEAADGSFTNAQYRSIHHMGYVPALVVDNEVITELPEVLSYISSLVPDKFLAGENALEQARIAEWLAWLAGTIHTMGFAMFWKPYRFSDDEISFDGISKKGMQIIRNAFDRIEDRLKGQTYAVGNRLTVVDFNLYVFSRWGKEVEIDMDNQYPLYSSFACRMEGIEGVKKAMMEEELPFVYAPSQDGD